MRVLITGTGGGVGQALAAHCAARHEVLACDRARLDITDEDAVRAVVKTFRPEVIVNPAALTNVDASERDPDRAFRVNAHAPGVLAACAEAIGALCVHLSTDYVFGADAPPLVDGHPRPYRETDPPAPLNVYGVSKRAGEVAALAACARTYIVRTAWVMNPYRPGFLQSMVQAVRTGRAVVTQQVSAPTGVADLVAAVETLYTAHPPAGIYHLVNAGRCARREIAAEVFRLYGVPPVIEEVPVTAFSSTPRPTFSALETAAWCGQGFPPFRPWQDALADALRDVSR